MDLIPSQVLTAGVFGGMDKWTLKFIWEGKPKQSWKKNKVRDTLPGIKTYYRTTVIKTVWFW